MIDFEKFKAAYSDEHDFFPPHVVLKLITALETCMDELRNIAHDSLCVQCNSVDNARDVLNEVGKILGDTK